MHRRAAEACERKRRKYLQRVEMAFTRDMLIFMDESAVVRKACNPPPAMIMSALRRWIAASIHTKRMLRRGTGHMVMLLQDSRRSERRCGWAQKNRRTSGTALFVRGKRYTIIGAVSWAGLIDWMVIERAAGAADMVHFFDNCLVRRLHTHIDCAHAGLVGEAEQRVQS
jgi:hypothetical protein